MRYLLAEFFLALGSFLIIITHGYRGIELGLGIVALAVGFSFSEKSVGNKRIFVCLILLLLLSYTAVGTTILWGTGKWIETLSIAVWMTPLILLYVSKVNERIFLWWIPLLILHSATLIVEGLVLGEYRPSGLLDNPNPASAILIIGVIVLLKSKYQWWSPLLIVSGLITGSRSSLITMVSVVTLLVLTKTVKVYKPVVVGLGVIVILISLSIGEINNGLRINGLDRITEDLKSRWEVKEIPSIYPRGYTYSEGSHNIPLRIAGQIGIPATLMWIGVTLFCLYKKPRLTIPWWILATLSLLSITEYHTWLGPLAPVWWIVIKIRTEEECLPKIP